MMKFVMTKRSDDDGDNNDGNDDDNSNLVQCWFNIQAPAVTFSPNNTNLDTTPVKLYGVFATAIVDTVDAILTIFYNL